MFLNSSQRFATYDEFVENISDLNFDAFVAGSDQIWNTAWMPTEEFYRYYMLDFAPSDKKIAYAPNIGVSKITDEFAPNFQHYLADFRFLSAQKLECVKSLWRSGVFWNRTILLMSKECNEGASQARLIITQCDILGYSLETIAERKRMPKLCGYSMRWAT